MPVPTAPMRDGNPTTFLTYLKERGVFSQTLNWTVTSDTKADVAYSVKAAIHRDPDDTDTIAEGGNATWR